MQRPHKPAPARIRPILATALVTSLSAAVLNGCANRQPPAFQVVAVDQRSISDTAIVLDFTIEGTNPNHFELPLRDVRYTVAIDGAGNFNAIRSAEATLPRRGSQRFILPAVVSLDAAEQLDDTVAYRLIGTVEYRFPDPLSDVLFDTSVRRPSATIGITGQLDFTGTEIQKVNEQ